MYPTIYHLVSDLFGIEIPFLKIVQSFGFFVALAFLSASWFFTVELKRKEKEALIGSNIQRVLQGEKATILELISSALFGFAIGYKLLYVVQNYHDFVGHAQQFILSANGSFLGGIIGAVISGYLKYYEKNKERLPEPKWVEQKVHPYELVGNMTLIAAVSGILGAKIFHNLENLDAFLMDPMGELLSFSGLTMYGGLIFGSVSVIYYAVKNKINAWHLIDACAPGLMFAYAVGRIGCQVAGDGDWGIVNTAPLPGYLSFLPHWMWAYNFPHNVNEVGVPIPGCTGDHCFMLPQPVFPAPFYETVMCLLLFVLLWSIRKKIKVPGVLFSVYLAFNGIERFLIEHIRVNTLYHIAGYGITQAQIISTLLFFIGLSGIFYLRKKHAIAGSNE